MQEKIEQSKNFGFGHSFFQAPQEILVKRGTDILTVVNVQDISQSTPVEINSTIPNKLLPNFKPDGAGAMIVFHTESGVYVLGGVRSNPALTKEITKDNTPFPEQINSTIGGYVPNPEVSLKKAITDAIKNKMFLTLMLTESEPGFDEQQVLKRLLQTIENDEGWETTVCIHTDHWFNQDQTEGTMCFMTAIKHISCSDAELTKLDEALQTTMAIKKSQGVNPRALVAFKLVSLEPIIQSSLNTYLDSEIVKATKAYNEFGNSVAVTFNDLAVATLAQSKALRSTVCTGLTISNNNSNDKMKI